MIRIVKQLPGRYKALFAAYQRAPAGTVILIVYLAPVGIAIAAPRVLGEALNPRTIGALALAAAGFVLVAAPTVGRAKTGGLLLALAAAVTFTALVLESKILSESYGGLRLAFMEMTGAGPRSVPHLPRHFDFSRGKLWPNRRPGLGVEFDPKPLQMIAEVTERSRPIRLFNRPDGSITNW